MPDRRFYGTLALTGGVTGALDKIWPGDFQEAEGSLCIDPSTGGYLHSLDFTSGLAENSPSVIKPDRETGDPRWILQGLTLPNTGLHLLDTNASHDLIIKPGSDLNADWTLTLTTGNANRTVTFSGNPTLDDWFDQAVKTTSSPAFVDLGLTGDITIADDHWIGLGAAKGRMEFDSTPAIDEINFLDCRVGIGTSAPEAILHLQTGLSVDVIKMKALTQSDWNISRDNSNMKFRTSSGSTRNLTFDNAGVGSINVIVDGNFAIGTTTFGTNAAKTMALALGTDPTADVANQFAFWGKDFAVGNTCPYFRTENGTVIGLNQSLLTTDPFSCARVEVDGPESLAIQTVTGNTTLDNTHSTVLVNASGNVTITLPTAASAYNSSLGIGRIYEIKKIDADADTVTVDGDGAEQIDGAVTAVLTVQWECITIQSNGTAWYII